MKTQKAETAVKTVVKKPTEKAKKNNSWMSITRK
jgi:hypothetical protein